VRRKSVIWGREIQVLKIWQIVLVTGLSDRDRDWNQADMHRKLLRVLSWGGNSSSPIDQDKTLTLCSFSVYHAWLVLNLKLVWKEAQPQVLSYHMYSYSDIKKLQDQNVFGVVSLSFFGRIEAPASNKMNSMKC